MLLVLGYVVFCVFDEVRICGLVLVVVFLVWCDLLVVSEYGDYCGSGVGFVDGC